MVNYDGKEKIAGKGENAGNQHFLLFPQFYQNTSSAKPMKQENV